MSLFNVKDGIITFDFDESENSYSFKLDGNSKKVIYSDLISSFLQEVKKVAESKKDFTRKVEHAIDENRHVKLKYPLLDFREWVCKDILHLEETIKGYNIPKKVTPELVDSLYDYDMFLTYHPFFKEILENGEEDICEVCQKDNGRVHLDTSTGIFYVNGKKVLEECICCPKCGRKI